MTTEGSMARTKKPKRIGETMIGFDLKNNDSYSNVNDIHHTVGRTSRTASEAFKDADYATPIWKCSTDFDRGVHFLKEAVVGFAQAGLLIGGIIFLIMWVFRG
jgi:hypothetical protein